MVKLEVPIPIQVSGYVERLLYERLGFRNLIAHLERACSNDDVYRRTLREYQRNNIEYTTAMEMLRSEFVPDEYKLPQYSFEVNFADSTLKIIESKQERCDKCE